MTVYMGRKQTKYGGMEQTKYGDFTEGTLVIMRVMPGEHVT